MSEFDLPMAVDYRKLKSSKRCKVYSLVFLKTSGPSKKIVKPELVDWEKIDFFLQQDDLISEES